MGFSTVFSQIVKVIPRTEFESWVHQYDGDRGIRSLDCWSWFGALLFGQLSGHDSIRAIERVFACSDSRFQKLGFGPVRRSTLADANHTRPLAILEQAFHYVLSRAKSMCPHKHGFRFNGDVVALDASTLQLCLSLSPWANFDSRSASVKLHTAIDLAGELPEFAIITKSTAQEMRVIRHFKNFRRGSTLLFDRGYTDFSWFNELNQNGVFFVTRMRSIYKFKVVRSMPTDRTRGYLCDQLIYFNGPKGSFYQGKLRRISFRDPDTGRKLVFLTNRFDLATSTICMLYKARWKVELFFKTLKQNLKIRKFLGNSFHAVRAQIWIALIAYLLVQIFRFQARSTISMPDAMAVLGTLLLLNEPVTRLLGALPRVIRHRPNDQLLLNV